MAQPCAKGLLLGMAAYCLRFLCLQYVDSSLLPNQCGSKPIGFSITTFNHVELPATALLGDLDAELDPREQFLSEIWRVGVGSIALTAVVIPGLKIGAYILAEYSKRRTIGGVDERRVPLISFSTQYGPVFHALSRAWVLESFFNKLRHAFVDPPTSLANQELRNALSTVFKTVAIRLWRDTNSSLIDRCGAQGLFEHNQLITAEVRHCLEQIRFNFLD